jgi:hypothetical protein
MGIDTSDRPPAEVLMQALAAVEKAQRVTILLESDDAITVKTNCTYRELKWMLDQAAHVTMNELFGIRTGDD